MHRPRHRRRWRTAALLSGAALLATTLQAAPAGASAEAVPTAAERPAPAASACGLSRERLDTLAREGTRHVTCVTVDGQQGGRVGGLPGAALRRSLAPDLATPDDDLPPVPPRPPGEPPEPPPGPDDDPVPDPLPVPEEEPAVPAGACDDAEGTEIRSRFLTCQTSTGSVGVASSGSGNVVGSARWALTETIRLDANSRAWVEEFKFLLHSPDGEVARPGNQITLQMLCNACSVDSGPSGPQAVQIDVPRTLTFGVSSLDRTGATTISGHVIEMVYTRPDTIPINLTQTRLTPATRCDTQTYIQRARGGGCVFTSFTPSFTLSRGDPLVDESAWHIYQAQRSLIPNDRWGLIGFNQPLERLTGKANVKQNRDFACKPPNFTRNGPNDSCDEFPFASTYQGAFRVGLLRSSRAHINLDDNRRAGSRLGQFYSNQRVLDRDDFWVHIT